LVLASFDIQSGTFNTRLKDANPGLNEFGWTVLLIEGDESPTQRCGAEV
jgi:hypothetical protein